LPYPALSITAKNSPRILDFPNFAGT
jgi:hypothetical protein